MRYDEMEDNFFEEMQWAGVKFGWNYCTYSGHDFDLMFIGGGEL